MTTEQKVTKASDKKYTACSCEHQYFDETFGKTVRPHNPTASKRWRCVVCGNLKG